MIELTSQRRHPMREGEKEAESGIEAGGGRGGWGGARGGDVARSGGAGKGGGKIDRPVREGGAARWLSFSLLFLSLKWDFLVTDRGGSVAGGR